MTVALTWPCRHVLDGLGGFGAVELPGEMESPDDAEHLDVDNVRGRMVDVCGQSLADGLGGLAADEHLGQA